MRKHDFESQDRKISTMMILYANMSITEPIMNGIIHSIKLN